MHLNVINLKKHWGNNTVGECVGVTDESFAWIKKNEGCGEALARYNPASETVVLTRDADGGVTGAKVSPKKQ